ncbi:MAG: hypothetical protein ACR2OJ_03765 [Hyphomicrobiales bacterium]
MMIIKGWDIMVTKGLSDPLSVSRAIAILEQQLDEIGLKAEFSNDMGALAAERLRVRASRISPMFDPDVNDFNYNNAFWMRVLNQDGDVISLQAFRRDEVGSNLADWALPWMIGLYARRSELIVPNLLRPPPNSKSERISGSLAYHGELWISRNAGPRNLMELIPKLGLLLTLIKWQPDATWALVSHAMATRGHALRSGYAHFERGFLNWDWKPEGAEDVEWLVLSERTDLEFIANDLTYTNGIPPTSD